MLKAKDIMTKNVISIKKNTPILEALQILAKNDITGIPVVREDMILVGVLSEKDALRLVYNQEDARGKTVDDFMTQPAIHFDENENFLDICDCLITNYFRRIPVTSEGKLVGIISRRDIIRYILSDKPAPDSAEEQPE
ncbi:MAG: CBS domain-containing protein [Planctomycetota bacterium]|nr:MAG: CBS domain-containing protein [Planctomycetota bacterium]